MYLFKHFFCYSFQRGTLSRPGQTDASCQPVPSIQLAPPIPPAPSTSIPPAPTTPILPAPPALTTLIPPAPSTQQPPSTLPATSNPLSQSAKPNVPGPRDLVNIKKKSSSRRNFAKNVATCTYSKDERMVSNVNGRAGKKQLSPNRMEQVRVVIFNHYLIEAWENERIPGQTVSEQ